VQGTQIRTAENCTLFDVLGRRATVNGVYVTIQPPGVTVSSTVPCENGRLEGDGAVAYFYKGKQYWQWDLSAARGLVALNGQIVAQIDRARVSLKDTSCGFAGAYVVAPPSLAYEHEAVWTELKRIATDLWTSACKRQLLRGERFGLVVFSDGSPSPNRWVAIDKDGGIDNHMGGDDPFTRHQRFWDQFYERQINEERRQTQLREADRIEQEREAKRQQLVKQTGTFFTIATLADIAPNPFAWQGKTIGTCVSFQSMVGPTTANVDGGTPHFVLLLGVPTTKFTHPVTIFLVARVTPTKANPLSLQYVGSVEQPPSGCTDFVDR
jgi:hypothetical protein